ncbi:MAG: response regulator [Gemmatimonadota bacterium]|nr:response regulator [Gemmatimonadota bacterium]
MTSSARHSLLRRQIRRIFRDGQTPGDLEEFLEIVDEAYRQFDDDRLMLERSLDLSSDELFEANSELRALFQALPDIVLRAEPDGTVIDVKTGSNGDLYRDAEFLLGRRFQDGPLEGDVDDIESIILDVLARGRMRSISYRLRLDGQVKYYEARILPFLGKQVLIVVRDITERERALSALREAKALLEARVAERTAKLVETNHALREEIAERRQAEARRLRLETKLLQSQKLESLGVLAGGIAHDFNNLLMAILGNAALARQTMPVEGTLQQHLREIEAATLRASGLTNQLLAYSGKGRFVIERIDVSEATRSMADLLEVSVSKKTKLVYELASDLPLVEADATQVSQVVMNLITNASEALGSDGGTITLRTGVIDVDAEYLGECVLGEEVEEGPFVVVEVSDNGIGMDAETVQKIFDPFFTTKFTGRGLGLAAVLGIVKGHRGAVRVASAPDKGTRFTLLLPAVGMGEGRSRSTDEGDSLDHSDVVLVVDDDPAVRRVIRAVVERAGYRVIVAEDGRDGLAVFRRHIDEIVCVVLDMTMPVMDGHQAFEQIRTLSVSVPVVLMSGYTPEEAARGFDDRTALAFIQKPFMPADLLERIESFVEGRPGERIER